MDVRWRAFPLHPETPEEGRSLEDLFAGTFVNIPGMLKKLKKTAHENGLPFGTRMYTYNSRLAQELGLWAEKQGKGEAFHLAAFKAYFADGKNIAKFPVLMDIVKSAELPEEEAAEVLEKRTFRDAVDADWALSRQTGIAAAPTFVMDREKLVGAQPYEMLERFVRANGAQPR